jgi:hypothetical protein
MVPWSEKPDIDRKIQGRELERTVRYALRPKKTRLPVGQPCQIAASVRAGQLAALTIFCSSPFW